MEDYWPRRLLHIPSFVSVERKGFSEYSGVDRPKYNILTYTWGRWHNSRDPCAPVLPVRGTTWKIPPIMEDHFTVDTFRSVINELRGDGCDWAWVDVACIDQECDAVKADEVGRQASIFKNASHIYVWLSHLTLDQLKPIADCLSRDCRFLSNFANKWFEVPEQPLCAVEDAIERLHRHCGLLFQDPWFSSLWTLQEYFLRNDADVISAEGSLFGNRWTSMRENLGGVYEYLEYFAESQAPTLTSSPEKPSRKYLKMAVEIQEGLARAGFRYGNWCSNPNVQYATARFRSTSRAVDRIYAITQIYNLRVGQSARPNETPSLEELSLEFAVALNASHPILAQMFNHEHKPEAGSSWRITEACFVPQFLHSYNNPRPRCTFRHDGTQMVAVGQLVPLHSLIGAIDDALMTTPLAYTFSLGLDAHVLSTTDGGVPSYSTLRLDASGLELASRFLPIGGDAARRLYHSYCWQTETRRLTERFGKDNLAVLLLGDLEHADLPSILGLVIRRNTEFSGGGSNNAYERLGVCLWTQNEIVDAVERLHWRHVEIILN